MGAGRPLKFPTVEGLRKQIDCYFKDCDENDIPYLITGLALALDTSRETLINYEKKEKYFDTIRRAKLKIHHYVECLSVTTRNPNGSIFNLKNNFGWVDRKEIQADVNVKGELDVKLNAAKERLRENNKTVSDSQDSH